MRPLWWFTFLSVPLAAQTPSPVEVTPLLRDLRTAIQSDSLASAAELAATLDAAVQERYRAWLIRDSSQRVEEALRWLPAETESLWVNQQPFTVRPEQSIDLLYGRPIEAYSVDRLAALNGGEFYRALGNHTVRLVVAAAGNIARFEPSDSVSVPGPSFSRDVAYVYFFGEPIELRTPDESLHGRPVWRGTATVDAGEPIRPGVKRAQREDENWLALVRPDVLILTNRHELLEGMLQRVSSPADARALPSSLPEWSRVDRTASFWAVRHYTVESKPKSGERGYEAADLPHPDGAAVGVAVRFASAKQQLEIQYLSPAPLLRRRGAADTLAREFQVEQTETGVWRLMSDVAARGPFPVEFMMSMLGFGIYR